MYKFKFLLTVLLVTVTMAISAKAPIKFGKVTPEELNMKVYDKNTTANAVFYVSMERQNLTLPT